MGLQFDASRLRSSVLGVAVGLFEVEQLRHGGVFEQVDWRKCQACYKDENQDTTDHIEIRYQIFPKKKIAHVLFVRFLTSSYVAVRYYKNALG